MSSGYQDFLDGLNGKKPEEKEEEPTIQRTVPAAVPKKPVLKSPTIQPVEEMTITFDDDDFGPEIEDSKMPEPIERPVQRPQGAPQRPLDPKPQVIDHAQMIGYKMTEPSQLENWVSIYERSLKARVNSPVIKKISAGQFVVRGGNVEILSDLRSQLGADASPADIFEHNWTQ